MKIAIPILFLLLSLSGKGQTRSYLDSLNEVSKSLVCVQNQAYDSLSEVIIAESQKREFYSQLGSAYIIKAYSEKCRGNHLAAVEIIRQSITYFNNENDENGLARAYKQIADSKMRMSEMDSAFYYASLFHKSAASLNDTILLSASYLTKSGLHNSLANGDSTIYYAIKGLEVLGEKEHDNLRGSLNISIGNTYYQNEDYPRAIKYYRDSQEYFSEESMNMGLIYHNLASSFTQIDEFDSSFHYLFKTIPINKKFDRNLLLAYNYQSLAHNYAESGDCEKSIDFNLLSIKISDEIGEIKSKSAVLANISKCYLELGRTDKAVESVKLALQLVKETGDQDKEADAYFLLSEAYRSQGKYKEAFDAHKRFYSLDSMLLGMDRQSVVAGLEARYDSKNKEAEIATLSQQASIQLLQIEQRNQAIIIGLILFILIAVIVYFVYREKNLRTERSRTELEQRFLRSQLNPHFIFNALLAIQNFMLKNDGPKAALYLTKFSKLMREILESSRQEFIPLESEVELITNYLDIHKMRLNDAFDYSIEIDPQISPETDTIPPMFVQPFVENAIEHGISEKKSDGFIDIKFKKNGDHIAIEILDNGKGLIQQTSTAHKSLASTIIQERMALFNRTLQTKIQLVLDNIRNEQGEIQGTKVELKVPFSYI
ncbi:MAG: histidine kinase [Cyclobacteriaceae bacterium]